MKKIGFLFIIILLHHYGNKQPLCDAMGDDAFSDFRHMSMKSNPTRTTRTGLAISNDLYQPYYVCGSDDDSEALNLNEWHYSCKQSCSDSNTRHLVNITRTKWDYTGVSVDIYKINTYKTCWTSHMNIWGSCSHAQTTYPVETTSKDAVWVQDLYFTTHLAKPGPGVQHVINSKQASCDYFSDIEYCARDYEITHKLGKVSKKSEVDPEVLNIYSDGIRVDPYVGVVHLNDVSYIWDPKTITEHKECGWKDVQDTTCSLIETSDTLKCDDIGYTYNIHDIMNKTTCKGEIFDVDGPSPFRYLTKEEMKDRATIVKRATEGKSDPDISFITGVNYALSELESTYCSSMCDLFSKTGKSNQDHVLDTPIGAWRLQTSDPLKPKMLPCMPTADWVIKRPFQMCKLSNSILVKDKETGHVNLWDAKKDYIILDQLCGGFQDNASGGRLGALKAKMVKQEEFKIEFWNGDVVLMIPPYEKTIWRKGSQSFRSNPSWFTKVKLESNMIHTRDDISSMLTEYVSNVSQELRYKKEEGHTFYKLLTDEILDGIENAGSNIWTSITGLWGGITKIIILIVIIIVLFIIMKILVLVKSLVSYGKGKHNRSGKKVMWKTDDNKTYVADDQETTPMYQQSNAHTSALPAPRTIRRSTKKDLSKLLDLA